MALNMIVTAIQDVASGNVHANEALDWLCSDNETVFSLSWCADAIGVHPDWARRRALDAVRGDKPLDSYFRTLDRRPQIVRKPQGKRTSQADRRRMIALYQDGLNTEAIARETGFSQKTVSRVVSGTAS